MLQQQLQLEEQPYIIGVVARLDLIKNHRCLFDAFQKVKKRFSKLQLLVVGDGPEKDRLKAIAGEGVRFLGNREDVPDIYRAFDLFVLPSNNEGISNTVLEAMASGLPVIASHVGGNLELVENNVNGTLVCLGGGR